MFNVSARRIAVSTITVIATGAFTLGASSEAWGKRSWEWDKSNDSHSKRSWEWDRSASSTAKRSWEWDRIAR